VENMPKIMMRKIIMGYGSYGALFGGVSEKGSCGKRRTLRGEEDRSMLHIYI
jgi:hypothetical protein